GASAAALRSPLPLLALGQQDLDRARKIRRLDVLAVGVFRGGRREGGRGRLFERRSLDEDLLLAVAEAGEQLARAPRRPLGEAAEGLLEVLERRQVLQALQAEVDEELARRGIEEGLADDLLAAGDPHQPALEEGLEHPGGRDAAQLLDLRPGDR